MKKPNALGMKEDKGRFTRTLSEVSCDVTSISSEIVDLRSIPNIVCAVLDVLSTICLRRSMSLE